ncbi:glycoside hydrolase family 3 protein [Caproiciproducens sp. R1]|uniref:glycoside hydrolase family 3 protein n=1 Tax=Caproiciproducens sp. R1 TaxID=3435000 RepID=UPI0040339BAD
MKRVSKSACALLLVLTLVMGMCIGVNAASTSNEVSDREKTNAELSRQAAAQGMVLLENKDNVLPIASKTRKIALFGSGARHTVKGGTGSGDVNQRYVISIDKGFKNAGYEITSNAWLDAYDAALGKATSLPDIAITDEQLNLSKTTDTAIYVISRISGEGGDRTNTNGDYQISENETANITKLGSNFKNVIILLNVGGIIDTKFFTEISGLDAMVLISQPGMEGGNAVADILTGSITPSGKLSDTWAKNYSDYPSAESFSTNDADTDYEYYDDGIYVGYRYFDTFNVAPAYEFGYGKSYTTFNINTDSVTADEKKVTVKATVTNTGTTYSGKEVVQVYFSAPNGSLEKPYQELAGYAKTDLLAPGQKQTLTITYETTDMSSYDEDSASYIMEKGDYIIRIGNSSRNTHAKAILRLDDNATTEQLSNQLMVKDSALEEITSNGIEPYSYLTENAEIASAKVLLLKAEDIVTIDNSETEQSVTSYLPTGQVKDSSEHSCEDYEVTKTVPKNNSLTLKDVYDGKVNMQEFVAQLSLENLVAITTGSNSKSLSGDNIGAQANSVKGGAGETTSVLFGKYKVPNIVLTDGPAGIRITQSYTDSGVNYYQYCTAWPVGTLLAMTWDVDLLKNIGKAIGTEMLEYGSTLWLAPALNIHRNPLGGRNFEYYSEDPLISGLCGAWETLGVQSHPGIGVTIKHFALNNQEVNRLNQDSVASERAIREIYLKAFEISVKSAQPMAIMTSLNQINGEYAAQSRDLLTNILRDEWKYKGLVMTDWGSPMDRGKAMHAGVDVLMPGSAADRLEIQKSVNPAPFDYTPPKFNADGTINITKGSNWSATRENWNDFVPTLQEGHTINEPFSADKYVWHRNMATGKIEYEGHPRISSIYLGDVQNRAINDLRIIMQSIQFKKMFPNIKITSYSAQFKLENFVQIQKSTISSSNGSDNSSGHHSSGTKTSGTGSAPSTGSAITGSLITTSMGTFITDTTTDVRVKGSYTVKLTSENGQPPKVVVGTPGVFEAQLTTTNGKDYFVKLIPIGQPGTQAGIYLDGIKLFVATVETPVSTIKSDTTLPFKIKSGASYVIKLTAGSRPTLTPGTAGVFSVEFIKSSGNDYFFRIIPAGRVGGSSGFYINSEKKPVTVVTIA